MANALMLQTGLALLLLIAGVADDLRARRVHNHIVFVGFVLALGLMVALQGLSGFMTAGLSFLTALVAVLPLYILRAIGGGDVKLFLAVSILMSWQQVLIALFAALIWGSFLGIFQIFLKGEGRQFLQNLMRVLSRKPLVETQKHQVPFTIALFFGFLSSFVWTGW